MSTLHEITGTPAHRVIRQADGTLWSVLGVLGAKGEGAGFRLDGARGIALDAAGDVYVSGAGSDNVLKVRVPVRAAGSAPAGAGAGR